MAHQTIILSPLLLNVIKTMKWLIAVRGYDLYYDRRWAARHLLHHRHTDTEKDPYIGVFKDWQHVFNLKKPLDQQEIDDVLKNHKNIMPTSLDFFYNRFPYGFILLWIICIGVWGWIGMILALLLQFAINPVDNFFNFVGHRWPGYRDRQTPRTEQSRNLWYLWFLYLGEELHGNHHRWPARANLGIKWWEIDITFWVMKFLSTLGLAKINGTYHTESTIRFVPVQFGKIQ
jgi:stearoyl-CoA desaturase (delta-9 desaturase)